MQNLTKLLEMLVYLILFCMAVTILLFQNRFFNTLTAAVKNEINSPDIFYEKERPADEISDDGVSYAELITALFGELSYDVQINLITIEKESYNYREFDFSKIPQTKYRKSYQYDTFGNIRKVIYTS